MELVIISYSLMWRTQGVPFVLGVYVGSDVEKLSDVSRFFVSEVTPVVLGAVPLDFGLMSIDW